LARIYKNLDGELLGFRCDPKGSRLSSLGFLTFEGGRLPNQATAFFLLLLRCIASGLTSANCAGVVGLFLDH